jgi:hypothetical protein
VHQSCRALGLADQRRGGRAELPGDRAADEQLVGVEGDLVTFRGTLVFEADGEVLESDETLRFRGREEVAASLAATGFLLDEVRDAPDRPGRELVFVARRVPS